MRSAACWECCGRRLGARFRDRLARAHAGTISEEGLYQAACKSPRSHRQPEAGTRETGRGDPRAARAMGAHADPQRRPSTGLGHGLRAGNGCAGFCMRQDTEPPQRLSRRVEGGGGKGKARRCSVEGRCWGGEGRLRRRGGEGDGEGDISDAGLHPCAIGGSGPPPDAPMSSGDPSHRVRKWSEDHLLNTSGRSSVLQRTRGARERENGWDAMRSADGVGHQWGVRWRTTARATHTGAGKSVLESVARHLGSSNRVGESGDVVGRAANMDAHAHEQGKLVAECSSSSMYLEV